MSSRALEQKQRRQAIHGNRRINCDNVTDQNLLDGEEVERMAKTLAAKAQDRTSMLRQLRDTFGARPELVKRFVKVHVAVPTLVTLLTGADTSLQLETLAVVTNMAAVAAADADTSVDVVLRATVPYLVTYLNSSNQHVTSQTSWAIGNFAAGGQKRCKQLVSLGVLHNLLHLLESTFPEVVISSAFALTNFLKFPQYVTELLQDQRTVPILERHLTASRLDITTLEEVAWVVYYITARSGSSALPASLSAGCLPESLAEVIVTVAKSHLHRFQILTPLVRSAAALCCDLSVTSRMTRTPHFLTSIGHILAATPELHLRKETLWLISNMAAHALISEELLSSSLVPQVMASLASSQDIKIQACECLCNLAGHSSLHRDALSIHRVVESVTPLLGHPDTGVVTMAMALCEILLTAQHNVTVFRSCAGRESLEKLVQHSDGQLCTMAGQLLRLTI